MYIYNCAWQKGSLQLTVFTCQERRIIFNMVIGDWGFQFSEMFCSHPLPIFLFVFLPFLIDMYVRYSWYFLLYKAFSNLMSKRWPAIIFKLASNLSAICFLKGVNLFLLHKKATSYIITITEYTILSSLN